MLYWLYDLPSAGFAAIVVAAFVVFGIGGLLLTRWLARRRTHHIIQENDIVGFYFGAVVGFYGITLGLISVGVWQTFSEADTKATMEATSIETLYRMASSYPDPQKSAMQSKLLQYTEHVIKESWPAQRAGRRPSGGTAMFTDIQKQMMPFNPSTPGEVAIHQEAIRVFNTVNEFRRLRALSASSGLPATMWWVVVAGAAASIILTWLFTVENQARHVFLTTLYSALIGLLIFLIAALDNPYRGDMSVGTEAYEVVLERMKKI